MILSIAGICSAQTVGEQIDEAHGTLQSQQNDQASTLAELRAATEANKAANEKTNERITTLHDGTGPVEPDPGVPPDTGTPPDVPPDTGTPPDGQRDDRGNNLHYPTYWTRGWVMLDLAKQADLWRDNGPGKPQTAFVYWKTGFPPPGSYTAVWTGSGSIRFDFVNISRTTSNSVTFTINPQGVMMTKIGEVSSLTILPDDAEPSTFHPEYLKSLEPFSVLRFMDWGKTNTTRDVAWSDRTTPDMQSGETAVPLEHMIELSNILNADPWFCMPHTASDDYIRKYAQMVKADLHPDATIYVEWSNEVWNAQFGVYNWVKSRSGGNDLGHSDFYATWAERSINTFRIWREVFAGEEHRIVRVAATQLQNPDVGNKYTSALNGEFDAFAPSGYVGLKNSRIPVGATSDTLIDMLLESIPRDNAGWYQAHADRAAIWSAALGRKIRLITYEAGQHLSPNGDDRVHWYQAYLEAQVSPRMFDVYIANIAAFDAAGGDLFTAFNDVGQRSKHGSWGHRLYQNQPLSEAFKLQALLN